MSLESKRAFTKNSFYILLIITIYYKTFVYIRNKKVSFLTDDDDKPRKILIGLFNIWVNVILYSIIYACILVLKLMNSQLISQNIAS